MANETDAAVAAAEKEVDAYFESRLPIRGMARPAVVEALLSAAELVVTGHRTDDPRHEPAIRTLYSNVIGGLNNCLRATERLATSSRSRPSDDMLIRAHASLSAGMMYQLPQHAFFSYWKGYATATFPEPHVIHFQPTGTTLDARLRSYHANDGIGPPSRPFANPLLRPQSQSTRQLFESMLRTFGSGHRGNVWYAVHQPSLHALGRARHEWLRSCIQTIPAHDLGGFTFSDLLLAWCIVWALAGVHRTATVLLARDRTDISTSAAPPTFRRTTQEWLQFFSLVPQPAKVLKALTFHAGDKGGDIAIAPLVPIGSTSLGIVPSVVTRASQPRNLLVLLARRFTIAYSNYSVSRERVLLDDFQARFPRLLLGRNIHLPQHAGRQLPDIDLLIGHPSRGPVLVAEVKWQLSASDIREVISRNDYLKKGTAQLARLRAFLTQAPMYLAQRGLTKPQRELKFLLLCKGHLGNEDVLGAGMTMADYDRLVSYLATSSLLRAIDRLNRYDYLPVEGRDFKLATTEIQLGKWRVAWKQFEAMRLPPDTETHALETLYARAAEFMPKMDPR